MYILLEVLNMDTVAVKKWGNSQGIRIPKTVLNQLDMHISDELEMSVVGNSIILKKAFQHKTFEERLAAYGGKISVCDFDWGEPVGKELL